MPKVSKIEKKIYDIEGFEVTIKHNGKDARSDMELPNQYKAQRMSKNSFSVGEWRNKFKSQFVGLDVDVLKADGSKASGQTKLATVRDTYLEDCE